MVRRDRSATAARAAAAVPLPGGTAGREADELIMLRRAVEAAREAVFMTDRDDIFTYVNPEFTRLYGYTLADVIGKLTPKVLDSGHHGQEVFDSIRARIQSGQAVEGEFVVRKRDGCLAIVEAWSKPILDEAGRFVGHLSVHRDITRRRQQRELLQESERRFRLIAENTADYILTVTLSGVLTWVSPSHARLGFSAEEMIGKPIMQWLHPEDVAQLTASLGRYATAGADQLDELKKTLPDTITFRLTDKSGRWHYVEASVAPVEALSGKGVELLVVSRDVTGRMWAERELKAQKELVERAISATPNTVLVVGRDGRVVLANDTFYRMFPGSGAKIDGQTAAQIACLADLTAAIQDVLAGRAAVRQVDFEVEESGRALDYAAKVVSTKNGEAQVIIADVTEERRKQETLYTTHRLASVGQMAAGAAHELNNPLTSIIGLSQLLMRETLSPSIKDDIECIHREAQRAASITRNLLTFVRAQPSVRQPGSINGIVEDVLKLRSYEHEAKHIQVDEQLEPALPPVPVDAFQMQQVFLNIVLNAEDAMLGAHGGGRLTVTTAAMSGRVRISFVDDGPGIAPEHMPHIFDPFFTTKEVGKGSGLGLSIAHGVVTNHGGRIWAESVPGRGAAFIIELPLAGDEEADAAPRPREGRASG